MRHTQQTKLFRWMVQHPVFTFITMGLSFICFGMGSLNLAQMVQANIDFLRVHGLMAIADGGLWQLATLSVNIYIAVACYIVFKSCEHALVERLAHHSTAPDSSKAI